MSEIHFTGGQGAIWMQPKGPGTNMVYLGCHEIAGMEEPLGDYTPFFCPDPTRPKTWVTSGETFAPPEAVTAQIMEDVTASLSYLEVQKCPFPLYINMVCNGRKDVFTNYEKTYLIDARKITNRSYENIALRDTDERASVTHDVSGAPPLIKIVELATIALTMPASTEAINDIWICKDESCYGQCDDAVDLCQYMITGNDAAGAASAKVLTTSDTGATWTEAAADPFASDETIESVVCFALNKTTTRWLVARGAEATPATPLEVAYSDDSGATWTLVDVEAGGTRAVSDSGALFALDPKHIWLVAEDGYIFFSSDGALNWTNQDAGTVTVQNYNSVKFANADDGFAVADSGIVSRTIDGGATWTAVTTISGTPNVLSLFVFDKDNLLVGDDGGDIWRSWDGGTTWTSLYTGTSINDMDFVNPFAGFVVDDTLLLRTRNGGEDWETVTIAASLTELNAVVACDENNAYVVGEDGANAGIVLKASGS